MVNVWGALTAFAIMGCAFWRMRRHVLAKSGSMKFTKEQLEAVLEKFEGEGDKATVKT